MRPNHTEMLHAHADYTENGYRPQIRWCWEVLWESDTTVPYEHGDYDNSQEAAAKEIAMNHMVERLRRLFE